MDAFYAAVEAQRNPALRDRPLVVGADPKEGHGRGVVTAASYAARRYGIRSALPISRAWRLAEAARRRGEPETIFVRDDHALYREVSARIMAILAAAGDAFQKTSADEAYLELSPLGSFDAAVERARRLKAEIVSQEGLTASVGIGPNKLVAKIASDFEKPDGLTVVRAEEVQPLLDPLRIRVIPGIGPKTERFLHQRHIWTVADLRTLERAQLADWFGRWRQEPGVVVSEAMAHGHAVRVAGFFQLGAGLQELLPGIGEGVYPGGVEPISAVVHRLADVAEGHGLPLAPPHREALDLRVPAALLFAHFLGDVRHVQQRLPVQPLLLDPARVHGRLALHDGHQTGHRRPAGRDDLVDELDARVLPVAGHEHVLQIVVEFLHARAFAQEGDLCGLGAGLTQTPVRADGGAGGASHGELEEIAPRRGPTKTVGASHLSLPILPNPGGGAAPLVDAPEDSPEEAPCQVMK